ncbi:hypothetical protein Pst134EA_000721 [Puccinia striiformis f. sp. tritici]|uniref:hypothetical protein n=1 Tax=Puccinia striiformis f. sp. tritici TaxID=168172 RepID=UPI0020082C27|nr:hypothetical protein Pst134EA_000721 [Puccinia striiformis f. sp. tritici]KAH9473641.1 hypothetical protein Pst134EA_000721 [Puccinia striiformis f. sp. tritici]
MLVVGLTGGIASGKSTVSGLLKSYNLPVIDLDELAREVVKPGTSGLTSITHHFSPQYPDIIHASNHTLNRERLAEIIFNDPTQRTWVNNLLHPKIRLLLVYKLVGFWLSGHKICVVDSPLLIETGMWKLCGKIIIVYCSEELQLQRLQARNGLKRGEAQSRIQSQMALKTKLSHADYIVDNSGELVELNKQIERLIWKFEKINNKLVWFLSWIVPPFGLLNGLVTVLWRVWIKPFAKSSFGKSGRRKRRNSVPVPDSLNTPSY